MKIFLQDGLCAAEAWYLNANTSEYQAECNVFVNPTNRYLLNKTILITDPSYDYTKLSKRNRFVSRFPIELEEYLLIPYEVSSELQVQTPFTPSARILTLEEFRGNNVRVEQNVLKLRYSFMGVDAPYVREHLTFVGLIGTILGIL